MKTNQLTGPALDWAVALSIGARAVKTPETQSWMLLWPEAKFGKAKWSLRAPSYSTDWSIGGPLIEKKGVFLWRPYSAHGAWAAKFDDWPNERVVYNDAPLVAAMRCIVIDQLGNEIDIPRELIK